MFGSGTLNNSNHFCGSAVPMSRREIEIWNAAIEAAAEIGEQDHGSYCEEVGNNIRKLKK